MFNCDPKLSHVKTEPIEVMVTLVDGARVEGYLHLAPNLRLTDLLNLHSRDNPFLAVTDANICFADGERNNYKFFSINREMIVCCVPKDE